MNTQLLNNVARYLAANGIELEAVKENKDAVIGLVISTLVDLGLSVSDAWDTVYGKGAYRNMADSVYEQLNA